MTIPRGVPVIPRPGYAVRLTDERVKDDLGDPLPPLRGAKFYWVARWKMGRLPRPIVPSYRYELVRSEDGRRWEVVAMQNRLLPYP